VDISSLQQNSRTIVPQRVGPTKFKLTKSATAEELRWAQSIALRAAQIAGYAMTRPVTPLEAAARIRQNILQQGAPWVSLETLLDHCWSVGIPVLHVAQFPRGARKMDGLAAIVNGRPVVALCRNSKYSAWLLFILAHELGHIARGHLQVNGVLLDEKVEATDRDHEEQEANQYAIELLTGDSNIRFTAQSWLAADRLAPAARSVGQSTKVDPGVVTLNYAWGAKFYPVAMKALAAIEPAADAPGVVRAKMQQHLDWERLPEDSREFLLGVTASES
jgi:Zn-dependent peptidase ImmA (M78 family)